jgi:hypothetical protein
MGAANGPPAISKYFETNDTETVDLAVPRSTYLVEPGFSRTDREPAPSQKPNHKEITRCESWF